MRYFCFEMPIKWTNDFVYRYPKIEYVILNCRFVKQRHLKTDFIPTLN